MIKKSRRGELDRVNESKYNQAMEMLNTRIERLRRKVESALARKRTDSMDNSVPAKRGKKTKRRKHERSSPQPVEKKSQRNLKRYTVYLPKMRLYRRVRALLISERVAPVLAGTWVPILQQTGLIQYPIIQLWLSITFREDHTKDASTGRPLGQLHFDSLLALCP